MLLTPVHPVTALASALGLGVVYLLARAIYNVVFHPLAKVPGPKLYAITSIPLLYYTLRGTWVYRIHKLHETYGPVVRIAPNDVDLITADAWKTIHGHKGSADDNYQKDPDFYDAASLGDINIVTANDNDHRRHRRLVAHAFSEKALRGQEEVVKRHVDRFIAKMHELAGSQKAVDMARWLILLSFDMIGDLAFAHNFGGLQSDGHSAWVDMIVESRSHVTWTYVCDRIFPRSWVPTIVKLVVPKSVATAPLKHTQRARETARQRVQSGNTEREDFMSYMLRHSGSEDKAGLGFSEPELLSNARLLIGAGSSTTSSMLSGTVYHLLMGDPAIYNRLVAEIRGAFATEADMTVSGLNQIEYMTAVLHEAMRIYPPIPIGLPRIVPPGGRVISGYILPAKSIVSVTQFAAYRSSRNFAKADEFHPERWLDAPGFEQDQLDVVQPFSTGPRNCVGKNLAYMEMRTILARLLWNFDLEILPESKKWDRQRVLLLWVEGPLMVKLHPVKRGHAAAA